MNLDVDARTRKIVADLVDARADLALSTVAVALSSVAVQAWRPPRALVLVGVLPCVALVLAQGGARLGRARASERAAWPALGAESGFVSRLARCEGGCFGAVAGATGGLVGSSAALAAGASSPAELLVSTGAWLLGAMGAAVAGAWIAADHAAEQPWQA
jgi:hypothetical protein